jgi:hypothetical protein
MIYADDGSELDATFHLDADGEGFTLVFESRGGTRATPSARNTQSGDPAIAHMPEFSDELPDNDRSRKAK